ncbi:hypothetical protein ACIRPP_26270 [Streptomyces sp. NPDC101219]|uniref:hypothetical protein n=1 Tax=Streptomyces sp. NPDC101219 TaxID=3366131 RepID=UPI0037F4DBC1
MSEPVGAVNSSAGHPVTARPRTTAGRQPAPGALRARPDDVPRAAARRVRRPGRTAFRPPLTTAAAPVLHRWAVEG